MTFKALGGLALVGLGWATVLAFVMGASGAAPAALVPFASPAFLDRLPPHVAITDITPLGVVLMSDDADFVADLYAAGAPLVLPAGLEGCAAKAA